MQKTFLLQRGQSDVAQAAQRVRSHVAQEWHDAGEPGGHQTHAQGPGHHQQGGQECGRELGRAAEEAQQVEETDHTPSAAGHAQYYYI